MQKVLTAEQMSTVDRLTTERYGIPSILLMENAAHAVARVITEKLGGSVKGKSILILCGPGNNGGDGAALARILANLCANVDVFLFGKVEKTKGDARVNYEIVRRTKFDQLPVNIPHEFWKFDQLSFEEVDDPARWARIYGNSKYDVVVDALFGTGLTRKLDERFARLMDTQWLEENLYALERNFLSVAIDIPSGLDADSPKQIGVNSHVDVTITFTAPKIANILPEASRFGGELIIADIGSPYTLVEDASSSLFVANVDDASKWLEWTKISDDSYKNKRGHALVIAGSDSYSGAAVLAGDAAMRSGAGLVTIATPNSSKDSVASRVLPEIMVRGVAETKSGTIDDAAFDELGDLLKKANAVAIGSGLGQNDSTRRFVQRAIGHRTQPMIVDADALNLLSPFRSDALQKPARSKGAAEQVSTVGAPLILTPHEGEFMRLLGTDDKDAITDRVAAVRDFAVKHDVILVLKGERVLIGEPGGKVVVNPTGNSGLGKAGNGDTLTGIITGFAAQAAAMNIDIFETVVAAVYVAGMAGDIAEAKYGKRVMTASDVRECLVDVFAQLSAIQGYSRGN